MKARIVRATTSVVLVFLTACASTHPPTSSTPALSKAQDRDRAKAIVLTKLDFPRGWKASTHKKDPTEKNPFKPSKRCQELDKQHPRPFVSVSGKDFSKGPLLVQSSVDYVRSEDEVRADLAQLRRPILLKCIRDAFSTTPKDALRDGFRVTSTSVKRMKVIRIGDGAVGFRIVVKLAGRGRTVNVYADLVGVAANRAEISVLFIGAGAPFGKTFERKLLSAIGRRLGVA